MYSPGMMGMGMGPMMGGMGMGMGMGGMMDGEMLELMQKRKRQIWNPLNVIMALVIPSCIFAHIAAILAFDVREKRPLLAILFGPVLCLILCIALTLQASKRLRWFLPCRGTCTIAAASWIALVFAVYAGDANYQWYMRSYYTYNDLAAYTNIDPSEDRGQSYMDSGEVYFKESSYVLKSKAIAFENARIYCAAPIVRRPIETSTNTASGTCPPSCAQPICNAGESSNGGVPLVDGGLCTKRCSKSFNGQRYCGEGAVFEDGDSYDCSGCAQATDQASENAPASGFVDFWAVGVDCCKPSGADFTCGAVKNKRARAGIRMVRDDIRPYYAMAVEEWAASRNLVLVKHPLFFHWVEDPVVEINRFGWRARRMYLSEVATFVLLNGFFVFMALWALYSIGVP